MNWSSAPNSHRPARLLLSWKGYAGNEAVGLLFDFQDKGSKVIKYAGPNTLPSTLDIPSYCFCCNISPALSMFKNNTEEQNRYMTHEMSQTAETC